MPRLAIAPCLWLAFALTSYNAIDSIAAPTRVAPARADAVLQGDQKILHALNRLQFGPRPGEVEAIRQMGLGRWMEQQLNPQNIDDAAVEQKLSVFKSLNMTPSQLRLAYEADTAAFLKMLVQAQQKNGEIAPNATRRNQGRMMRRNNQVVPLRFTPTDLQTLNAKQRLVAEQIQTANLPPGTSVQAVGELANAKIVRAVESKRQLQEVLVDFWSNHFNLDVKKGQVRTLKIADEREVIRPHVLGKFRDLLGASAQSPAMLFYLDNFRSTRSFTPRNANRPRIKARGGINENYARELLELHTLGVDGGYTQKDVQEVARCLTGWSINLQTGEFQFRPLQHDNEEKIVLGQTIPAGGGKSDGEKVLDIVASHPSTARFIARKLCVRFISDEPPAKVVDRAAQVFTKTDGDLREVVRAIVFSPEFFATKAYRSKIKSPFEFAVSSVRALDGSIQVLDPSRPFNRARLVADGQTSVSGGNRGGNGRAQKSLAQQIALMGQPLFSYQAPTGWPEDSRKWVSTGALISRLNFALALTSGEVAQVQIARQPVKSETDADDHSAVLNHLISRLLSGEVSPTTRATLLKQMTPGTPVDTNQLTALVLGSPEFQRR
jgi:uncharacterized protein (DUF1800 family)